MTIPVQDAVTSSVANGVTTVFPFGFKILSADDLVVLLDDVEVTTGFTVSGVGSDSGGNVTFTVAPVNGVKVTRALQPELKREVDYQQFGDWLSPEVNNDFDRIWLALQMLNHNDKRSLRISVDNTIDQTILETPAERAGKLIGFDSSGNIILYAGSNVDSTLVSAFISTFIASTNQAEAFSALGLGEDSKGSNLSALTNAATARGNLGLGSAAIQSASSFASSGLATANGNTMNSGKLLGRSSASIGSLEEITLGSGLSLSAGVLTSSGAGLGVGQTWQSVTRTAGTTYYNTTGKPIMLTVAATANGTMSITVGGNVAFNSASGTPFALASVVIPDTAAYVITTAVSYNAYELR